VSPGGSAADYLHGEGAPTLEAALYEDVVGDRAMDTCAHVGDRQPGVLNGR